MLHMTVCHRGCYVTHCGGGVGYCVTYEVGYCQGLHLLVAIPCIGTYRDDLCFDKRTLGWVGDNIARCVTFSSIHMASILTSSVSPTSGSSTHK